MIARRGFIAGIGSGATAARAQERVRRIGVLRWEAASESEFVTALRRRLAAFGWIEGRNLAIEFGWADGDRARADALLASMLRGGVELIVAASTPSMRAAMGATHTVPIVMAPAADPVGNGFIASLARPGGNVTGVTLGGPDLSSKRVELLREAVPGLARLAFLGASRDPAAPLFAAETRAAAGAVGVTVSDTMVDAMDTLPQAFAAIAGSGAQALVVQPLFVFQRDEVAALALRYRLPAISELRSLAEAGLLMTYGTSSAWSGTAAAVYVDRILRGAAPADLPVEQPTRIELTVNLRTARALGLALAPSLLVRADEVIE